MTTFFLYEVITYCHKSANLLTFVGSVLSVLSILFLALQETISATSSAYIRSALTYTDFKTLFFETPQSIC